MSSELQWTRVSPEGETPEEWKAELPEDANGPKVLIGVNEYGLSFEFDTLTVIVENPNTRGPMSTVEWSKRMAEQIAWNAKLFASFANIHSKITECHFILDSNREAVKGMVSNVEG